MKSNFVIIMLAIGCAIGLAGFLTLDLEHFETDPANINDTVWETPDNKFLLQIQENLIYEDGQISVKSYTCFPSNASKLNNDDQQWIVDHYHFEADTDIYRFGCVYDNGLGSTHLEEFYYQVTINGRLNFLWPISQSLAQPIYNLKRVE